MKICGSCGRRREPAGGVDVAGDWSGPEVGPASGVRWARTHPEDGVPSSKVAPAEQEALPLVDGSPVAQHMEVEPAVGDQTAGLDARSRLAFGHWFLAVCFSEKHTASLFVLTGAV